MVQEEESKPSKDDAYEDVEMPGPGGAGSDVDEGPDSMYATVAAEHKAKKR